jgi:hypothetical protein
MLTRERNHKMSSVSLLGNLALCEVMAVSNKKNVSLHNYNFMQ